MQKIKYISFILAVCLILSSLIPAFSFEPGEISSKEDFIKFAKKCTLDTWSEGREFNLNCDISFEGDKFIPVPVFGGTFNGNGHKISGIEFSASGSDIGVFRYISKNGKVKNLKVEGSFQPKGSKSTIGGIVGENSGSIEQCSFDGDVSGENVIGGIAGRNTMNGNIVLCKVSGNIQGENFSGGIAGKNEGYISGCINNSAVNTVFREKKRDITDMDADIGSFVESYKNKKEENEDESILGNTDTGGITGYSSGIIQGCTNKGEIGCDHIGYNIGGIVGRQSGFIAGCENQGIVKGRKDVGGIAGQAEPYIILNSSGELMGNIRDELNRLHNMTESFISDIDGINYISGNDNIRKSLDGISEKSKTAQNNAEIIKNKGTDFVDENLGKINAEAALVSNAGDNLSTAFESLESGAKNASESLKEISDILESSDFGFPDLEDEFYDLSQALKSASKAEESISRASARASRAADDFAKAFRINDVKGVDKAEKDLTEAIKDINTSKEEIEKSVENIEAIVKKIEAGEGINSESLKTITESLKTITDNEKKMISGIDIVRSALDVIFKGTEFDIESLKDGIKAVRSGISYLTDGMYYIMKALTRTGEAVESMSDKLRDYSDEKSAKINEDKDKLSDALIKLSYAADDIRDASSEMNSAVKELSDGDNFEFVMIDDEFKDASDGLFSSVSGIFSDIDDLRETISDSLNKFSDDKSRINNRIREISGQFNLIMNLMLNEMESIGGDVSEIIVDASDEDIENTRQGKIFECENHGRIEGDRNTGGIAGSVAIEYAKDPEDDIEKPSGLNFTYRTKAIIQSCLNDGEVSGKKDSAGGIAGLAELGTIYKCENYGYTESSNGGYVGGIAGRSDSAIRKCYSKGRVKGEKYVGGIAGKGNNISLSYSISKTEGEEFIGALAGDCKDREHINRNFFIDRGTGGIDGVSYGGKAEPISFEKLAAISEIPGRFISFTVTFKADGKTADIYDMKYGEPVSSIKYPEIPEKKGYFGNWLKPADKKITEDLIILCEYKPYINIISSYETKGGLALALAEGEFTDEAEFHITKNKTDKCPGAHGELVTYDVSLKDRNYSEEDKLTMRFLNPERKAITAWQKTGKDWEKLKTSPRGKYVILRNVSAEGTICIAYKTGSAIIYIFMAFIFSALVFFFIFNKRKKNEE